MVGGRRVRDQETHIVRLADGVYAMSWDEPTGTTVSVAVNLIERRLHGVIFFPQWIALEPQKTACLENEHLMRRHRDAGPTYPNLVIDEFADITFLESPKTSMTRPSSLSGTLPQLLMLAASSDCPKKPGSPVRLNAAR
jgi:phenolic acid decarboxylase